MKWKLIFYCQGCSKCLASLFGVSLHESVTTLFYICFINIYVCLYVYACTYIYMCECVREYPITMCSRSITYYKKCTRNRCTVKCVSWRFWRIHHWCRNSSPDILAAWEVYRLIARESLLGRNALHVVFTLKHFKNFYRFSEAWLFL